MNKVPDRDERCATCAYNSNCMIRFSKADTTQDELATRIGCKYRFNEVNKQKNEHKKDSA